MQRRAVAAGMRCARAISLRVSAGVLARKRADDRQSLGEPTHRFAPRRCSSPLHAQVYFDMPKYGKPIAAAPTDTACAGAVYSILEKFSLCENTRVAGGVALKIGRQERSARRRYPRPTRTPSWFAARDLCARADRQGQLHRSRLAAGYRPDCRTPRSAACSMRRWWPSPNTGWFRACRPAA